MGIEVREPQTEEEFEEYYRLRYERLRAPHGQSPGSERNDPNEPISKHVIAKMDGRIVGAECWVVLEKGSQSNRQLYARSRQTAVDPDYEGAGVASAMLNYVFDRARELGCNEIVANVRNEIVGFAESLGFKVTAPGTKLFETVEHVFMVKPLR